MKLKIILTLLFLTTALQSVEKETVKEKPQPSPQQIKVEVQMRDRTFVIGSLENKEVIVKTPYGNLNIKLNYIQKIEFGLVLSQKNRSRIESLLAKLNSENEESSFEAENKILDMGIEILPYLYQHIEKSENVPENLSSIISELESIAGQDANITELDKVYLNDDSIFAGELMQESINFYTDYGRLEASKEKISHINFYTEIAGSSGKLKKDFKIEANKYIPVNNGGFFDTKIYIKKGDKLEIKASGEVTLASLSNVKFTPEGNLTQGNWMNIPFGGLAAKIGNNGVPFLVGKHYKGIAKENGVLYLTISETVFNASNSGEYKVSITK